MRATIVPLLGVVVCAFASPIVIVSGQQHTSNAMNTLPNIHGVATKFFRREPMTKYAPSIRNTQT